MSKKLIPLEIRKDKVEILLAALKRQDIWSTADLLKLIGAE